MLGRGPEDTRQLVQPSMLSGLLGFSKIIEVGPQIGLEFVSENYRLQILRGTKVADLPPGHRAAPSYRRPAIAACPRRRGDRVNVGMSAIGIKRTWACALRMSAYDPKRTYKSLAK
jgi:hypothetical protein